LVPIPPSESVKKRIKVNNLNMKLPPHDTEAERAVIGSILMDSEVIPDVMEVLKNKDFYNEPYKLIYNAIEELYETTGQIDVITVCDILRPKGDLEKIGGELTVAQLVDSVPTSAHAVQYANVVREKSVLRNLISAGSKIVESAYSLEGIGDILDQAERSILGIGERYVKKSFTTMDKVVNSAFAKLEKLKLGTGEDVSGLSTGYRALDDMTTGFHRSDLVIIAARPSMGKSAFALHVAKNMALTKNLKVGVFSLEMSAEQIALRLLSLESGVDFEKIRRASHITDIEWDRLTNAASKLVKAPLIIDDDSLLDPRTLRSKVRRMKKEHGLDAIVIDYLQLMNGGSNRENRQQEISEISRSLKIIGREMDIAVLAASQLSRAVEQRDNKRPRLSDLRESGAIEQDADTVIFIHREAYFNRQKNSSDESEIQMLNDPHEAEIIIGKQRNGPVGTVKLMFHPRVVGFFSLNTYDRVPGEG